ncbi:MAG: hypothetical protein Q4E76_01600 [Tissierellia bacterium]|nr:hypothetical protein [Tissierellia bacterium]
MKGRTGVIFFALAVLLCTSCVNFSRVEEVENPGEIEFFYNPYTQKIVEYHPHTKKTQLWDHADNQFQFNVDHGDIFVNGNSMTNDFGLLKLARKSISNIHNFDQGQGVFPIGMVDHNLYYIHTYYDENGAENTEKRRIGVYNLKTQENIDYSNTGGAIDYGAVGDEYIYYTVYNSENDDYSLYRVLRDEISGAPEEMRSGLKDGLVLIGNGDLYTSDGINLISDHKTFKKETENFFRGNYLFQYILNEESQLALKVTNIESDHSFFEEDIIGVRMEGNKIVICKQDGVVSHEL